MKVLICRSRSFNDPELVSKAVSRSGMSPTHIISGGARGVDTLVIYLPSRVRSSLTEYLADWDRYGKRAGFMRWLCDGRNGRSCHCYLGRSESGHKTSIDYATSQGKQDLVLRPEINKAADRLQPNGTLIRSSGDGWASLGAVRS